MRIENVRAFLKIVEEGSITKAAEHLHITQPALGYQLAELESELGERLIERRRGERTVTLTTAGEIFLGKAEQWLFLWDETIAALHAGRRDTFSIVSSSSTSSYSLLGYFDRILTRFPDCELRLSTAQWRDVGEMIADGRADAGIFGRPQLGHDLISVPLVSERFVLCSGADSDYTQENFLSMLDPSLQIFGEWCEEHMLWHKKHFGSHAPSMIEIWNCQFLPGYFSRKNSWCMMPVSVARHMPPELKKFEVPDGPRRIIYFIYRSQSKEHLCLRLLEDLRQYLRDDPDFDLL